MTGPQVNAATKGDLALAEKDIRLAIESADALGTPVPVTRAAHGTLSRALDMGLGENFFLATMEALEAEAGFTATAIDVDTEQVAAD